MRLYAKAHGMKEVGREPPLLGRSTTPTEPNSISMRCRRFPTRKASAVYWPRAA